MSNDPDQQYSALPSWLLRAKVRPLRSRIRLLQRPGLLRKLDAGLECKLTIVHAPAGYGKSTLLSDWVAHLQQHHTHCAWLSLDADDNDQLQLLLYVLFAIAESGLDVAQSALQIDKLFKDANPRSLLSHISHIIDEQDAPLVLVLDDFERLDADSVTQIIQPLLKYAPPNLHIVVATRDDSTLQVAALEARGLVNRLQVDDLRLSDKEQREYLAASADHDPLPADALQSFCTLSEGWPVAVQLLRVAIRQNSDWQQQFSNDARLGAYLSQQVFEQLAAPQQQFLLDMSIADRASIQLLNKLRGSDDAEQQLDSLKALHGLLQAPVGADDMVRPHPLFRDFLLHRLRREHQERYRDLSLACAKDCSARGDLLAAMRYCLAVNDEAAAVQAVLDAGGLILWVKEGIVRLRSALHMLSDSAINKHPRIKLIACLLLMKNGNVREAAKLFAEVSTYLATLPEICEERRTLADEAVLLDSMLAIYQGAQLSQTGIEKLQQRTRQDNPDAALLSHHYTLLCLSFLQRGELQQAREFAQRAVPHFRYLGSRYGETYMAFHLGEIFFASGDGAQASAYYQQAAQSSRQDFPDDHSMRMVANTLVTEIEFECDRLDALWPQAGDLPQQVQNHEAWFDVYAACYTSVSQLAFLKEGLDSALAIIDNAQQHAIAQGLKQLTNLLCGQKILLLLQAGDIDTATALSTTLPAIDNADFSKFTWRERDCICKAHAQLASARGEHKAALTLCAQLATYAASKGQRLSEQQFRVLAANAAYQASEPDTALQHLQTALTLCLDSGFKRIFLDEGSNIVALLDFCINASASAMPNDLLSFAKALRANIHAADAGLLSKREAQILQQLRLGHANKVIARNTNISENTVRFHLKNIFNKLDVENRVQAIALADKLNL